MEGIPTLARSLAYPKLAPCIQLNKGSLDLEWHKVSVNAASFAFPQPGQANSAHTKWMKAVAPMPRKAPKDQMTSRFHFVAKSVRSSSSGRLQPFDAHFSVTRVRRLHRGLTWLWRGKRLSDSTHPHADNNTWLPQLLVALGVQSTDTRSWSRFPLRRSPGAFCAVHPATLAEKSSAAGRLLGRLSRPRSAASGSGLPGRTCDPAPPARCPCPSRPGSVPAAWPAARAPDPAPCRSVRRLEGSEEEEERSVWLGWAIAPKNLLCCCVNVTHSWFPRGRSQAV